MKLKIPIARYEVTDCVIHVPGTCEVCEFMGLSASTVFRLPRPPKDSGKGFTLAQKMVGRACGLPEGKGIRPGTYCEAKMTARAWSPSVRPPA